VLGPRARQALGVKILHIHALHHVPVLRLGRHHGGKFVHPCLRKGLDAVETGSFLFIGTDRPNTTHADIGPQVSLDPAVMSRIVATRLSRGEEDRLHTDPLYLRRPDIQGQPTARL